MRRHCQLTAGRILAVTEDTPVIRYATGEIAEVGDRVTDDAWDAVVEYVITSADDIASWGLDGPGLMLNTKEAGFVFYSYLDGLWDEIVFKGRAGQTLPG